MSNDELELKDGIYYGTGKIELSGTPDKPIVIKPNAPGKVLLDEDSVVRIEIDKRGFITPIRVKDER